MAAFVGAELAPNVPLPNVLLLLCGVLELLEPNVKSVGFAEDDAAGLTFVEKLNPPLVDCCDEAEPNVNKEEFDAAAAAAALVSLGLVVENIVDAVVAPPKVDVVFPVFPKVGVLLDPNGNEVALLDGVPNVDRGFAAGELNTGNFVSGVPKIGGLPSAPKDRTLFSGMANPDGLPPVVVNDVGLSVLNAIVVFDSLLNSGVELETIGKSVATGVSFVALLVDGVASVALFPSNEPLVDNAADDVGI